MPAILGYQDRLLRRDISDAADKTDIRPSSEQKAAGNYRKGKFVWNELTIAIENPKGSMRWGTGSDGNTWTQKIANHYGYIIRLGSAAAPVSESDGDHLDCFIGDDPESDRVYVIDQLKPDGSFDEHKVMLGFENSAAARAAYLANYKAGWRGFGAIVERNVGEFKDWVKNGDTGKPLSMTFNASFAAPGGRRNWTPGSIIEVPDIVQHDFYSCGAAASMAVGTYFSKGPKTLSEWKKALGTDVEESTSPDAIVRYLSSLGLRVVAMEGMTIEDLAAACRNEMPVICPVQDYGPAVPAKAKFAYGHYLTVIGVIPGEPGNLVLQDSSEDNLIRGQGSAQAPGRILIAADKWMDIWHDRDVTGKKYIRYGIAVGDGRQRAEFKTTVVDGAVADKIVEGARDLLMHLTGDLIDRNISLASWQRQVAGVLKDLHARAGIAGFGGQMGPGSHDYIDRQIMDQIAYLFRLAHDIERGAQERDDTLLTRVSMYADAGRHTYQGALRRSFGEKARMERRVLGETANHCQCCLDAAAQSWVPVGTLPEIGSCQCLSNCLCSWEWSDKEKPPLESEAPAPSIVDPGAKKQGLAGKAWGAVKSWLGFSEEELDYILAGAADFSMQKRLEELRGEPRKLPYPTTSDAFEYYEKISQPR